MECFSNWASKLDQGLLKGTVLRHLYMPCPSLQQQSGHWIGLADPDARCGTSVVQAWAQCNKYKTTSYLLWFGVAAQLKPMFLFISSTSPLASPNHTGDGRLKLCVARVHGLHETQKEIPVCSWKRLTQMLPYTAILVTRLFDIIHNRTCTQYCAQLLRAQVRLNAPWGD